MQYIIQFPGKMFYSNSNPEFTNSAVP